MLHARAPTARRRALTVSGRPHSGRLLVRFAESADRDAAEALRGSRLLIDAAALPPPDDPDEFHVHQLEGLPSSWPTARRWARSCEVVHGPGGELLVLARPDGRMRWCRSCGRSSRRSTSTGGRVVLDPPEGLLDPL